MHGEREIDREKGWWWGIRKQSPQYVCYSFYNAYRHHSTVHSLLTIQAHKSIAVMSQTTCPVHYIGRIWRWFTVHLSSFPSPGTFSLCRPLVYMYDSTHWPINTIINPLHTNSIHYRPHVDMSLTVHLISHTSNATVCCWYSV